MRNVALIGSVLLIAGAWSMACGDEEDCVPSVCEQAGACAVFTGSQPIVIGFSGPLSGDVANYGTDVTRAMQIAVGDADAFHGHGFSVNALDDQGSPDVSPTVANQLVANQAVVGVIGPMFSGAANAAAPIYSTAKVPMVSPSATRTDLTQQGYAAFNRVVASDAFQGEVMASYFYDDLDARDLAIIHDGSAYGLGLAERLQDRFEALGGDIVAFEAITAGSTDYSIELEAVADENPDSLFFGGYSPEAAVLLTQREAAGLGDIPFTSDDGVYGSALIEAAGADAEGFVVTAAATPPDSAAKTAFDADYQAAFGEPAGSLDIYCWYGYDATSILIAAIRDVGVVCDDTLYIPRQELLTRVRSTSGYQGITGTITCDANGECAQGGFALYQVDEGAWVKLP